jgi:hypothetical protein
VARIRITPAQQVTPFSAALHAPGEKQALYFRFEGKGSFDFLSFELK